MTRPLLVLRPEPGAAATAARVRALGLVPIVAPLFRIVPLAWEMPERPCDAILMTSANAARALDEKVDRRAPVYAVGAATAAAAREAGFTTVTVGRGDVAQAVKRAAADGIGSLLHLTGTDRTGFDPDGVRVEVRAIYAAEAIPPRPAFGDALEQGAVALLHSARAARRFRELAGPAHRIAAISPAVRAAAGGGWEAAVAADRPTDDALLAAAARLCQ
ncbi:uroporphyrinogen-III synthase [Sphingomonas sp.]|jgi:uroporphyrinogen-III synthase|uniref:uroporphyrinogen-III synthase n=1 Tax=Sphingomonas sp. TaxID=28214 RepID=UPI002DF599C1|nr:uroporphyrinogen-III synthase [Sphingomonas sp.]HEV2567378.1 uroporphyrinogen-III synthase [Sphingomonas sp.]